MAIRIGVGGWTYEPWRGTFFPPKLPHAQELAYAARQLTSIEINGMFYPSQTPATFAKWRDETPDDFVFAVKAPRFATNRRVLGEAGTSIERFFDSGVTELGDKLGPINWQLPPTKKFDAADIAAFLALLPHTVAGRAIRHVLEVGHDSFGDPALVDLARNHGVAIVLAGDCEYVQIADLTAPLSYLRLMGTEDSEALGYSDALLDRWIARANGLVDGVVADDFHTSGCAISGSAGRDVYIYVMSGYKARNPAAAVPCWSVPRQRSERHMAGHSKLIVLGLLPILLAGASCSHPAAPVLDPAKVSSVIIGRSSRTEVFAALGRPARTETTALGETWVYATQGDASGQTLVNGATSAMGVAGSFVPYLGLAASSLGLANTAAGAASPTPETASLAINFGDNGIVRDCTYASTALPSGVTGPASGTTNLQGCQKPPVP